MLESDNIVPEKERRAWGRRPWLLLTVLLPLSLLVGSGLSGLDFGTHWDENEAFLEPLRTAIEEEGVLPRRYNYPSLGFALSMMALAPEALASIGAEDGFGTSFRARALELLPSGGDRQAKASLQREGPTKDFLLRLRGLFLLASALAVLWVHLSVLTRGGSGFEALLASSLLGLSFEVAYHLRWVAPDGLLMEAGALTLLFGTLALRGSRPTLWVLAAAVAAGLGCASKYPGGLLLIPASLAALHLGLAGGRFTAKALGRGALWVLAVVVLFAAVFTLVTPGVLLDSERFWGDVKFERAHYAKGHGLHTVAAGWEHLTLNLRYLGTQGLSHSPFLASCLSVLVLLGAWRLWREDRWNAALLTFLPLVHLAYMSSVRVFMVRNLIVLLPFMALLAARGGVWLLDKSPADKRAWLAGLLLGVLYLTNGSMLIGAAKSIVGPWPEQALHELAADLRVRSDGQIYLTPSIRKALVDQGLDSGLDHLAEQWSDEVTWVVAHRNEIGPEANARWTFHPDFITWYGSREVNLSYYPTWSADKLVWISNQALAEHGLIVPGVKGK
jgi:hypothetical protein